MNNKKKEEKRKKRGLLTPDEHFARRKERQILSWARNPKNKGKLPFN